MIIKDFFKKAWQWLLDQTTLDEQIEAKANDIVTEYNETKAKIKQVRHEVGYRVTRVREEVDDVVAAVKNIKSQIADISDAAKGNKRRGRKPKQKSKTQLTSNTTKPATKKLKDKQN
jgi:methyl-accepting chemotaxis protein